MENCIQGVFFYAIMNRNCVYTQSQINQWLIYKRVYIKDCETVKCECSIRDVAMQNQL